MGAPFPHNPVWQLFRAFGGPITDAENPLTLVARSILFAVMIGYAQAIFQMTLDIARAPYTALMEVTITAEDFTFAGIEEALKNGLVTIVATTSIVGTLLLVILEIALGWNYFKLLLETVERYVVVGVLCYTSPLAFAMGGSKETNSVFRSWCRMVGSQLILLIMNVWFLRAFGSSVGQFIGNGGALTNGQGSIFLWLFCALAFLKCAQRFDSYLSSIGLNVAQTGSSMAMEMMMAARVLSGVGGGKAAGSVFRGSAAAGSAHTTSTATGFASSFANRFKGNSYVRDAVVSGGTRMVAKLESVAGAMFPVTSVEKEHERIIPLTYYSYAPVTLTVITSAEDTGDGQFSYETGQRTYYYPYEVYTSEEPVTVDAYQPVDVRIPVYDGGTVTGFNYATYYVPVGTETLYPDTEIVKYLECTIHPFDNSVIHRAFGIDPSATYDQFHITYGEAIQHMANALKMTLYGSLEGGKAVPLTDEELIAFVSRQDCSPARKHILSTALSLVGKVPYFWGGKSAPGWNDAWNTPRLVTSEGSSSSGTIRPYGLDCSGFTSWVYNTAMGVEIGVGISGQFPNTMGIDASELLPGDLAFLAGDEGWEHVLIFAGYDESGNRLWVHCTAGSGVVLNIPDYESSLVFRRLTIVDYDADSAVKSGANRSRSSQSS